MIHLFETAGEVRVRGIITPAMPQMFKKHFQFCQPKRKRKQASNNCQQPKFTNLNQFSEHFLANFAEKPDKVNIKQKYISFHSKSKRLPKSNFQKT